MPKELRLEGVELEPSSFDSRSIKSVFPSPNLYLQQVSTEHLGFIGRKHVSQIRWAFDKRNQNLSLLYNYYSRFGRKCCEHEAETAFYTLYRKPTAGMNH